MKNSYWIGKRLILIITNGVVAVNKYMNMY